MVIASTKIPDSSAKIIFYGLIKQIEAASHLRCYIKKPFLKNSPFHRKTPVLVFLKNKVAGCSEEKVKKYMFRELVVHSSEVPDRRSRNNDCCLSH